MYKNDNSLAFLFSGYPPFHINFFGFQSIIWKVFELFSDTW